jgi:hypothetical protein
VRADLTTRAVQWAEGRSASWRSVASRPPHTIRRGAYAQMRRTGKTSSPARFKESAVAAVVRAHVSDGRSTYARAHTISEQTSLAKTGSNRFSGFVTIGKR